MALRDLPKQKMMFDLRCKFCKRMYGFGGADPSKVMACPHCGEDPGDEARADGVKILRLLRLCSTPTREMSGAEIHELRVAAGLKLGQAARMLGVQPVDIVMIEDDRKKPSDAFASRMDLIYGVSVEEQQTKVQK